MSLSAKHRSSSDAIQGVNVPCLQFKRTLYCTHTGLPSFCWPLYLADPTANCSNAGPAASLATQSRPALRHPEEELECLDTVVSTPSCDSKELAAPPPG